MSDSVKNSAPYKRQITITETDTDITVDVHEPDTAEWGGLPGEHHVTRSSQEAMEAAAAAMHRWWVRKFFILVLVRRPEEENAVTMISDGEAEADPNADPLEFPTRIAALQAKKQINRDDRTACFIVEEQRFYYMSKKRGPMPENVIPLRRR